MRTTDLPNTFPAERYESVELLDDSGAMGILYKCRRNSRTTAVKIIRQDLGDEMFLRRFKREIRILRTIEHSNIVSILDFNDVTPPYWYEMEYAALGNLSSHIEEFRTDHSLIEKLFYRISDGLWCLHNRSNPIIHRDLKPQNILVFDKWEIKIADVGIARLLKRDSTADTSTGQLLGTYKYASPEQLRDAKHVDARTDIYSLGIVLMELFTGSPIISDKKIETEIPFPFKTIIERMVRENPDERYQTINEAKEDCKRKSAFLSAKNGFRDPSADFDSAVSELSKSTDLSEEQLDRMTSILEHCRELYWVTAKTVMEIPKPLLRRISTEKPLYFEAFVSSFTAAITNIMKEPFNFGWMNDWTRFLETCYTLTTNRGTKVRCLQKIVFMASTMNQFFTIDRLVEMLSSFSDESDVGIAMEALADADWRKHMEKVMRGKALDSRLRAFVESDLNE